MVYYENVLIFMLSYNNAHCIIYSTTKELSGHSRFLSFHCIKSGINLNTLVSFSYVNYKWFRKLNKLESV